MFYRTVALNDPILANIESKENLIRGKGFDKSLDENMSELGVIVKSELLKTLHYKPDAPFIYMSFPETDTSYRLIPIPIVGVVKNLPGMKDLISTQYFYWQRNYPFNGSIFNPHEDKKLLLYTTDDSLKVYDFRDTLEVYFLEILKMNTAINVQKNTNTYRGGYNIVVSFWPGPDNIRLVDSYYSKLEESGLFKEIKEPVRLFNYESRKYRIDDVGRYENIAVNFRNLDKVRLFAKYLKERYELQIDIAQVNAKENYNFITKLTRIISLILIGFSILSVCLFVSNLLKRHLESIKMNIGTLKAFGLSNRLLQKIYVKLVFRFVSLSIMVSFILAWIMGFLGLFRGVLYLFGDNIEKGENYFKLFDTWTVIAVFLILTISTLVIIKTAKKILQKTPGDLIYNR
jgi:ABC-type antimicrobial peptide transport system permease subunit